MLQQNLVLLLVVWRCYLHCVLSSLAPFLFNLSGEPQSLSSTTRVLPFVASVQKLGLLRVVPAVTQLVSSEVRFASGAFESDEASPYFPVDVFPLDLFLVVHELNEAIQVEEPVRHVLSNNLAMEVNEDLGVGTHHPVVLFAGVESAAINAPAQECLVLTPILRRAVVWRNQQLELLHEELAGEFVSFVHQVIKFLNRDETCNPFD